LSADASGLEGDLEACAGGNSQAMQRLNNGLRGIHTLRGLLLGETRGNPRVDDRTGKGKLGGESFVSIPVIFVPHPFLVKSAQFGHDWISFGSLSGWSDFPPDWE
jgi:hypothetical protein